MKHYQSEAIVGIPNTYLDQMSLCTAKLANFWLMLESRTSAGYPFLMISYSNECQTKKAFSK